MLTIFGYSSIIVLHTPCSQWTTQVTCVMLRNKTVNESAVFTIHGGTSVKNK